LGLLRDDEERQAGLTAGCSGLVIKGTLVIHPATIHRKDSPSRDDLAGSGHARVLAWASLQYQIFTSSAAGTIGLPRRAAELIPQLDGLMMNLLAARTQHGCRLAIDPPVAGALN
jgi:hypothetical protein